MLTPNPTANTVCLVTCQRIPGLTADDLLFRDALERAGRAVEIAIWDDPEVPWSSYDAVILRSTWDYHLRIDEFCAWLATLEEQDARLWNPPALVRWNLHKGYLAHLAEAGVEIVPTEFLHRGDSVDLAGLLTTRGWPQAVIKPAISATAWRTFRTTSQGAAADQEKLEYFLADGDFLVQPFMEEIEAAGEFSFFFFGGNYSHGVLKTAKPGEYRVQNDYGGTSALIQPTPSQLSQAQHIADTLPTPWLYARIDMVEHRDRLLVMEVELIEPALFFREFPPAATHLERTLSLF